MVRKFDFLVIGSGIAGMSFALKVAHKGKVALICKAGLEEANTYFAQGGISSVTNLKVDNFEKHIEDTMIAGDWISDRAAVEKVVREAPSQIQELIKWGVEFDKKENGEFDLHKEGGHSEFRILHHKDRRRNTDKPHQNCKSPPQYYGFYRSLCSRNHYSTPFGYHRHPSYSGHQMFWRVCAERKHRRSRYFLIQSDYYGHRRL